MLAVEVTGAAASNDGAAGAMLTLPGGGQLRYGQLTATDATGRVLPARLVVGEDGIRIVVDDRETVYPLVVDPLVQQAKLLADDAAENDSFGYSAAISGDGSTAVIGAKHNNAVGAAYIFVRNGTTWSQQQKLTAGDPAGGDNFGLSVAMSGDGGTVVIGAFAKAINTGAAYVFVRSGTTWSQQQKLIASDGAEGDRFGYSVGMSGNGSTALIGADGKSSITGAAYVYVRNGTTWSQQQELTASDGVSHDDFGSATEVSGDGNTAVIGAVGRNSLAGAAYVFVRNGTTWSQQQGLTAGDPATGDRFGFSAGVSGDGNTVAIGAPLKNTYTGAAYIFVRSGTTWSQQQKLTANDPAVGDNFGYKVPISGDGAKTVIGAYGKNSNTGAAYVFTRGGTTWSQQQKLTASDGVGGAGGDGFGLSVAMSGDGSTAVIGAYFKSNNTGAAYIFAPVPPTVTGITPTIGGTGGGSAVTIVGTGFQTGATVTFGSAHATNVIVVNATTITATTPANSVGVVTVTVTNPDGGAAMLPGSYTYALPTLLPTPPKPASPPQTGPPAPLPIVPPPAGAVVVGKPSPLPPSRP